MEKCSLAIRIPYSDGELEGGARFSLGEGSKLDIYALDESKSIDVQKLSCASRPPRRERVATRSRVLTGKQWIVWLMFGLVRIRLGVSVIHWGCAARSCRAAGVLCISIRQFDN
jgi:hypothetical protein